VTLLFCDVRGFSGQREVGTGRHGALDQRRDGGVVAVRAREAGCSWITSATSCSPCGGRRSRSPTRQRGRPVRTGDAGRAGDAERPVAGDAGESMDVGVGVNTGSARWGTRGRSTSSNTARSATTSTWPAGCRAYEVPQVPIPGDGGDMEASGTGIHRTASLQGAGGEHPGAGGPIRDRGGGLRGAGRVLPLVGSRTGRLGGGGIRLAPGGRRHYWTPTSTTAAAARPLAGFHMLVNGGAFDPVWEPPGSNSRTSDSAGTRLKSNRAS